MYFYDILTVLVFIINVLINNIAMATISNAGHETRNRRYDTQGAGVFSNTWRK